MFNINPHERRSNRRRELRVEGLETRRLLYATLGGQWAHAERITYSFAPDGTDIGGLPSNVFAAMNAQGLSSTWQQEVRKAAAVWQVVTGVNIVQVSDDGSDFGTAGNQQNDSRFGDIRIGGAELAAGVLASAFLPPPFNGGTLAGDFVFSSLPAWKVNSNYDVRTVAIHEFGHSLGMDHSTIQSAVMYANYTGIKQTLTTDDSQGIQSIYGTRQQDAFESPTPNNTYQYATNLTPYLDANGQLSIPGLDITSSADSDWFKVVAPANTNGTMAVTIQSTNLSSLNTKVYVYNSLLRGVGSANGGDNFGNTASLTVTGVTAGQTYYVRAMAGNSGPGGNGAYGIQLNFTGGTMDPIAPPDTTVAEQPDQGGGSRNELAELLPDDLLSVATIQIGTLTAAGDNLMARGFNENGERVSRWRDRVDAVFGSHSATSNDPVFDVAMLAREILIAKSKPRR